MAEESFKNRFSIRVLFLTFVPAIFLILVSFSAFGGENRVHQAAIDQLEEGRIPPGANSLRTPKIRVKIERPSAKAETAKPHSEDDAFAEKVTPVLANWLIGFARQCVRPGKRR